MNLNSIPYTSKLLQTRLATDSLSCVGFLVAAPPNLNHQGPIIFPKRLQSNSTLPQLSSHDELQSLAVDSHVPAVRDRCPRTGVVNSQAREQGSRPLLLGCESLEEVKMDLLSDGRTCFSIVCCHRWINGLSSSSSSSSPDVPAKLIAVCATFLLMFSRGSSLSSAFSWCIPS